VSAVIASAIEDAEGFPIRSMPISPVELWELRQRHDRGEWPSLRHRPGTPAEPSAAAAHGDPRDEPTTGTRPEEQR
jgi:hypothetical protein